MSGVLAFLTAFGMILVYFKFSILFEQWSTTQRQIYFGAAVIAGLWGIRQFLVVYGTKPGDSRTSRRSRHRRHFPRPGVIYLVIMCVMFIGAVIGQSNMLILVFALM